MITRVNLAILFLTWSVAALSQQHRGDFPSYSSCADSPLLDELDSPNGRDLLNAYGYDFRKPWSCEKADYDKSEEATILLFRKVTAEVDDCTSFSVIKLPGSNHIWIIPTAEGMLEVPHVENDPHNLAAFNALLANSKHPSDIAADSSRMGKLYLAIVGQKGVVSIPAVSEEPAPCTPDECNVAFADRPVTKGQAYNKWTLMFSVSSKTKQLHLDDVSRKTVQPKKGSGTR